MNRSSAAGWVWRRLSGVGCGRARSAPARPPICQQPRRLYSTDNASAGPATAPTATTARPGGGGGGTVTIHGVSYPTDSWFNIPANVLDATSRRLHLQPDNPVCIVRQMIEAEFPAPTYHHHRDWHPVVSTGQNFDSLGFPADHPGRSRTDTYYVNRDTLLRTHTSAHQADLFRASLSDGFLFSADVYRRDAVDRTHYPVFHQMEGARMWDRARLAPAGTGGGGSGDLAAAVWRDVHALPSHRTAVSVEDPTPPFHPQRNPGQEGHHSAAETEAIGAHLKRSVELMVASVFARAQLLTGSGGGGGDQVPPPPLQMRWVETYFPFTSPSWELEVFHRGEWLEMLGCGIVSQELYVQARVPSQVGWAFGIGLDRLAMVLFQIPDIRLLWSRDDRFLNQFAGGSADPDRLRLFVPFSRHPACFKDVSFWVPDRTPQGHRLHENDVMEVVRAVAGAAAEDVRLVDEFAGGPAGRQSRCYRISYRSLERTLTNAETNRLHASVVEALVGGLGVEIR